MRFFILLISFIVAISQNYGIGEIRNLEILGIIDKRLVVKYFGKEIPIAFYTDEIKEIEKFPTDYTNKSLKYGIKNTKFVEFTIPISEKIVTITNKHNMTNFKYNRLGFLKWIVNSKNDNLKDKMIIFFKIKNNGDIVDMDLNSVIEFYENLKKTDL